MILALLVDDHRATPLLARAVTELELGVVAHAVPHLSGLAAALAAAIPDVVVTDLSLPGTRHPDDCLKAVRALWHGPLAVLTGDASPAASSACVRRAAARWLKPLTPKELAESILVVARTGVSP